MSARILLNLLNVFGKVIKYEACRAFHYICATIFYKFNNTGARMLDSIYHMTLKLIKNRLFGMETSEFAIFYATL